MFCLRMFITTDQFFTSQPLKLFRIDDDIRRVGATGKLAATGTVAVLKNILRTGKLITDGIIKNGMIPKIHSAVHAIENGLRSVRICDLDSLKSGEGTVIVDSWSGKDQNDER